MNDRPLSRPLSDLALDMKGNDPTVTAFRARVYEAVRRIPAGKAASYAAVAGAVGCRSARVVGQALRHCPFDDVPCHRVVAADGAVGGYAGRTAGPDIRRKKRLLMAEGVRFGQDGRIHPACLLRDTPRIFGLLSGKTTPSQRTRDVLARRGAGR